MAWLRELQRARLTVRQMEGHSQAARVAAAKIAAAKAAAVNSAARELQLHNSHSLCSQRAGMSRAGTRPYTAARQGKAVAAVAEVAAAAAGVAICRFSRRIARGFCPATLTTYRPAPSPSVTKCLTTTRVPLRWIMPVSPTSTASDPEEISPPGAGDVGEADFQEEQITPESSQSSQSFVPSTTTEPVWSLQKQLMDDKAALKAQTAALTLEVTCREI